MPFSDKVIKRDQNKQPIPQYFNNDPSVDDYEPLYGRNGAIRVELYDANGNPINVTSGKLDVRATELENLLNTLSADIDGLNNDVAKETTLSTVSNRVQQVIDRLGEVATTPTANTLADRLKQIADRLGEVSATPTANTVQARLQTIQGYLDGVEAALGTATDAEAAGDGSIIAILKRLRTILTDAWSDADNALQVRSVRRYDAIKSAPVVGVKTVTSTAAEIFAGASRLSGRYAMAVYNEGSQPVYWGGSSVTASNGFPLLPQDSIVFSFDPSAGAAIYMVAASNTTVRVVELA